MLLDDYLNSAPGVRALYFAGIECSHGFAQRVVARLLEEKLSKTC